MTDETVLNIIAVALDKPSLYMGGASISSLRRARDVVAMLDNYGYEVIKTKPAIGET